MIRLFTGCVIASMLGASVCYAEPAYTDEELYLLSHIINAEAGDDACSHEHRVAVGSVVLNRVESDDFPDTLYEVIYQPGQYAPTWNGSFDKEPSEDSVETAKYLLENGSQRPGDVVFQAEIKQGSAVYETFETIYGTTYICVR